VECIGNAFLKSADEGVIELRDVLYVPGAAKNLVSLSAVINKGAELELLDESRCTLIKHGVRMVAECMGGLYHLEGMLPWPQDLPTPRPFALKGKIHVTACASSVESPELWHARYGHLGMKNLAMLQAKEMVSGIKVSAKDFTDSHNPCEACELSKLTRDPFPSSSSTPVRGLLHVDLCGPIKPTSLGGSRYFLGVIEDESRFSLVTALKAKDQASSTLQDLICMLQTVWHGCEGCTLGQRRGVC
jgi:hypothetical protein